MSSLVVGSIACPIGRIYCILTSHDCLEVLQTKWRELARCLCIPNWKIKQMCKDQMLEKLDLPEIVNDVIGDWVARNGSAATLASLIEACESINLKFCADALRQKIKVPRKSAKCYCKISNEIQDFLSCNDKETSCVVSSISPKITCAKLKENLNNCTFFTYEDFLLTTSTACVDDKSNILVVKESVIHKVRKLLETNRNCKPARKLIVIFKNSNNASSEERTSWNSCLLARKDAKIINDSIAWSDLTLNFQLKLRSKLEERLSIQLENVDLESMLDQQTLVDIINDTFVPFGCDLQSKVAYYIKRNLIPRHVILKDDLFDGTNCWEDIFVFTGIDRLKLSGLVKTQLTDNSTNQICKRAIKNLRFLILDHPSHFMKVCRFTNVPVHWLHSEVENEFKWVQSYKSIKTIQSLIKENFQPILDEDSFFNLKHSSKPNQTLIIADSPGMGKSMLLREAQRQLNALYNDRAVILVAFSDLVTIHNKVKLTATNYGTAELARVIFSKLVCRNKLDQFVLDSRLKANTVQFELLLDGLDEVNSDELDKSMVILMEFHELPSVRLWVTTRPHLLTKLENLFSVLGFNIQPFSENNQVDFICKFWIGRNADLDPVKVEGFARTCLRGLRSNIKPEDKNIAGVPLQCLLLAEIFEEDANVSCLPGDETHFPDSINTTSIAMLYEKLVETKFRKYGSLPSITKVRLGYLRQVHQKLAFNLLFTEEQSNSIFPFSFDIDQKALLDVGIMEQTCRNSALQFIHRTFAEYFVALYLVNLLKDTNLSCKSSVSDFLFNELFSLCQEEENEFDGPNKVFQYSTITFFLNSICMPFVGQPTSLVNKRFPCEISLNSVKAVIFASAQQGNLTLFKFFQGTSKFQQNVPEIFTEDIIIHAVKSWDLLFVEEAFRLYETHTKPTSSFLSKCFILTAMGTDLGKLEYVVNVKNKRSELENENIHSGLCPVQACIENTFNLSEVLISEKVRMLKFIYGINKQFINLYDIHGRTPLLAAGVHVQLLRELLLLDADVFHSDCHGNTLLHINPQNAHLHDFEYKLLLKSVSPEALKILINFKNQKGLTALATLVVRSFASPCELEIFLIFGEYNANFNQFIGKDSLFAFAIKSGSSEQTLRNLVTCGADTKSHEYLLCVAAHQGNLDAVRVLLENNLDVNEINKDGMSPLDCLICSDILPVNAEAFYKTGIELYRAGGRKRALSKPVRSAICTGNVGALKLIFELELGYINQPDENQDTPLHLALSLAGRNTFNVVQFLMRMGADIYIRNKNGEGPLQLALRNCDSSVIDLISERKVCEWGGK